MVVDANAVPKAQSIVLELDRLMRVLKDEASSDVAFGRPDCDLVHVDIAE